MENAEDDFIKNAERSAKRNYLKEDLIDLGYDAQEFLEYTGAGEDVDIDTWNFDDLQNLVRGFKTYKREEEIAQAKAAKRPPVKKVIPIVNEQVDPLETSQDPAGPQANATPEALPEDDSSEDEVQFAAAPEESKVVQDYVPNTNVKVTSLTDIDAKYFYRGQKLPPAQILPQAEVSIAEIGMHASNTYTLTTTPYNWTVKRLNRHFSWLRQTLCNIHGGHIVPALAKPPEANSSNSDIANRKRKLQLERFVNGLISVPIFRQSFYLLAFLNQEDDTKFNALTKVPIPENDKLSEVLTKDGAVPVNPDVPNSAFTAKIGNYLKSNEGMLRNFKVQAEQLMNSFKELSVEIMQLLGLISNLRDASTIIPGAFQLEDIHEELRTVMKSWSNFELSQAKNTNEYLSSFFSFQYKTIPSLQEIFTKRESLLAEYQNLNGQLQKKKSKLWSSKDYEQWEFTPDAKTRKNKKLAMTLMLPTETQEVSDSMDKYGYYNFQAHNELLRMMLDQVKQYKANFKKYAKAQKSEIAEMGEKWKNFSKN